MVVEDNEGLIALDAFIILISEFHLLLLLLLDVVSFHLTFFFSLIMIIK